MEKSVFAEAVVQHHTPRALRGIGPPMHWKAGSQTLLLDVDPAVVHEPAPASLGHSTGAPGKQ